MSRSPEEIQSEIESARHQLSTTLDQLVERTSPKKLADDAKTTVIAKLNTPAGRAVIGAVAGGLVLMVVLRIRSRHS